MKMNNPKRVTGLFIALLMAITFMAQPLVVLADTYSAYDYTQAESDDYTPGQDEPDVELDPVTAARVEFFEMLYHAIPEVTRFAYLTDDAREIALYDFDYFANKLLLTAPTRHMFGRLFGVTLEDYLAGLRQMIYDMVPVPSLTDLSMGGERWTDEPTDELMIAADYMFTLLLLFAFETGGFGHFLVQELPIVEEMFFITSYVMQGDEYDYEALLQELREAGLEDPERSADAMIRFHQVHYEIYNRPSVLWFYDIDPSQFDFDVDLSETVGFMDEDNVFTYIVEPGRIAYIGIASFFNNMVMDWDVLFPFYEEIQDFEHLIIDLRGNGGGFAGYFSALVVSMLIDESISFTYPEFFVSNELTAVFYENPMSLASADLYGIFPAAEFVRDQNMHMFNRDDLALLDNVAVWNAVYSPSEYAIPFGGEIWLLVDEGSASASVMAAQLSVNTGFATVVGEPTSGVTGVVYTFAALPNTGILFRIDLGYTTDQYGRSIEEFGVIPQIVNLPGMDALETVLAIIDGDTQDAEPHADEFDGMPVTQITTINGVPYVRLRYLVYNLNIGLVEWDGPNNSVIVHLHIGDTAVVAVSTYGIINYNGWIFVPLANVDDVLMGILG
ncbi:MAG: S41 family peptidase [Defluviitaleaceae bacterium]|nr:S41 family peptidase [Defluviitaleaceae bacterium]